MPSFVSGAVRPRRYHDASPAIEVHGSRARRSLSSPGARGFGAQSAEIFGESSTEASERPVYSANSAGKAEDALLGRAAEEEAVGAAVRRLRRGCARNTQ